MVCTNNVLIETKGCTGSDGWGFGEVVEGGLGEENLAGVGHEGKAFGSLEAVAFGEVGCDFAAADAAYNGVSRGDAAGDSRDVAAFSNAVFADASEASGLLECGFEDAQGVVGMIARRTCETRAECGVGREERASVCEKGLCGFLEKSAGDEAVLEGRNFSSKRGGRFHAGGTAGDETQVGNSHSAEFLFAEFLKWRAGHRREKSSMDSPLETSSKKMSVTPFRAEVSSSKTRPSESARRRFGVADASGSAKKSEIYPLVSAARSPNSSPTICSMGKPKYWQKEVLA